MVSYILTILTTLTCTSIQFGPTTLRPLKALIHSLQMGNVMNKVANEIFAQSNQSHNYSINTSS